MATKTFKLYVKSNGRTLHFEATLEETNSPLTITEFREELTKRGLSTKLADALKKESGNYFSVENANRIAEAYNAKFSTKTEKETNSTEEEEEGFFSSIWNFITNLSDTVVAIASAATAFLSFLGLDYLTGQIVDTATQQTVGYLIAYTSTDAFLFGLGTLSLIATAIFTTKAILRSDS
jgi:hypothetical protein